MTKPPLKILVITATKDYRHDSIETAIEVLKHCSDAGKLFEFTFTERPADLFDELETLLTFEVLCFLSSTGDILNEAQLTNLALFTERPEKAIIGIHAATCTCVDKKTFTSIFGTAFHYHPQLQQALVYKVNGSHPSTANFPAQVFLEDEWYNFTSDPRDAGCTVLLAVDESTYTDTGDRLRISPHPVCWCRDDDPSAKQPGARVWYTSLGHSHDIWRDGVFVDHVLDGLKWASRLS